MKFDLRVLFKRVNRPWLNFLLAFLGAQSTIGAILGWVFWIICKVPLSLPLDAPLLIAALSASTTLILLFRLIQNHADELTKLKQSHIDELDGANNRLADALNSLKESTETQAQCFDHLHLIGHECRQTLMKMATYRSSFVDPSALREEAINNTLFDYQSDTVDNVIARVSKIFTHLTRAETTATFWRLQDKRLTENSIFTDGINDMLARQRKKFYDYSENTVFFQCSDDGAHSCHFFCPDLNELRKDGHFKDQRLGNEALYQSVIIVPIRYKSEESIDRLGYLQLDQKATHRLNHREYLYLLSAIADQLYSFLYCTNQYLPYD